MDREMWRNGMQMLEGIGDLRGLPGESAYPVAAAAIRACLGPKPKGTDRAGDHISRLSLRQVQVLLPVKI
jgi:hypothetical protein